MRARTILAAILPLTSILVACGPSGPAAGPSQVAATSIPVEVSAPTATPSPAPTSTKAPTPTPPECEVVAVANTTVYDRPSLASPVFGNMSAGDTAPVGGWTPNGWLGFEPGVAQAANMGVFRLRWVENTSSIRLQGPCSQIPVEPWVPAVGVCYDMAMSDTAVHYLASTGSVVLATMHPGDFAAVTGVTSTGFARVDLLGGFPQRPIKGWIQSSDLNLNGPCESLPTISPSAR